MDVSTIATTASNMTAVAVQPSTLCRGEITKSPITRFEPASNSMTAMMGTAITPLITALANSALIGSMGSRSIAAPPRVATAMML